MIKNDDLHNDPVSPLLCDDIDKHLTNLILISPKSLTHQLSKVPRDGIARMT